MVFVTAGMGGGTGTGASPVIARVAKEMGAMTVAVVTLPFEFEGSRRKELALKGMEELKDEAHSMIMIPNQRLFKIINKNTTIIEAFHRVDEVLLHAVKGIVDLITLTGLVNVDFADVKTIMSEKGLALMGMGEKDGDDRAKEAAHKAISNPLLEEIRIEGARGLLINVTGGPDLTLYEITEATDLIRAEAHESAMIIFGAVIDEEMQGKVRVTVIATGFDSAVLGRGMIKAIPANDALDIPTIIRQRQQNRSKKLNAQPEADEQSMTDYDTPAFMRKRMD
jgi:cell division protein FtsZ